MNALVRATAVALAAVLGGLLAVPAPADPPAETVKDRAGFIPNRKHRALPGKAVGILLTDGQPVLSAEGRSGPPDQLCFSTGGGSYRWVYVPVQGQAQITNLRVPVGDKGEFKVYPSLDMARPKTVAAWGINTPYTLVEVEVNDGQGSPAGDSFVATSMKRLDGTKEYPLDPVKVVDELKQRYKAFVKDQAQAIDAAMLESQKKALQERKPTGPREQSDLMYLTWMPETKTLRAHFRTKITDGAYSYVGGGLRAPIDPIPLPPPPKLPAPPQAGVQNAAPPVIARRFPPPPPPRDFKVRVGTTFGVEFGVAYEVSKDGAVIGTQGLPFESFWAELPVPPGAVGPVGPRPVPLPPAPPVQDR